VVPPGIEPGTQGFSVCPAEYKISSVGITNVGM